MRLIRRFFRRRKLSKRWTALPTVAVGALLVSGFLRLPQPQKLTTTADVVVVATTSLLKDVLSQLDAAARSGARAIVSTSEELAWVRPEDGPEAGPYRELAEVLAMPFEVALVPPRGATIAVDVLLERGVPVRHFGEGEIELRAK